MRSFVLVMLLATACGEDGPSDPHEHVTCSETWAGTGFTTCEAACNDAARALNAMGPACEAATEDGPIDCTKTFTVDGLTGCCATANHAVAFAECNVQ